MLQLSYPGGLYSLGVRTLEPGATAAVNVRALRDSQAPDDRGHRLPAVAGAGQVHWSIRGPQKLGIIGRAEDLDATRGLSSSYACVNRCPDSYAGSWLSPSRNTDTVGGHSDIVAWQQDQSCYGSGLASYVIGSPSWSSANTGIATIDGSGVTTGIRGGTTTLTGAWTAYSHNVEFGGELGPVCVTSSFSVAPSAQEEVDGCGDVRDDIIYEYVVRGRDRQPSCGDLSTSGGSTHFSFNELNSGDYRWAWIEGVWTRGLENTRTYYGRPMIITSGYRNPARNDRVGGVSESARQYGRAADVSATTPEAQEQLVSAAMSAGVVFYQRRSRHVHLGW